MRHVEDALLVAYADDALNEEVRADVETHLATCAECRARVAQERALADRAAAVLGAGVPDVEPEMPAFAEILRRSEASDATSSTTAHRPQSRSWTLPPLAWAAMLVVGLGAAVIARTLLVSPEFNTPAESRIERAEAAEDALAPRTVAAPAESVDAAVADAELPAAGRPAAQAGAASDASGADAPTPPPAPAAAAAAPSNRALSAAAETAAAKTAADQRDEPALRERPQDAPQVEPSRERERFADMLRRDTLRAAAQAPRAEAVAAAPPPPAPAEIVVTGAAAPGAIALSSRDAAWRGESVAAARARGASVAGVPDAPVTSIWLAGESAAWRARVVQQVDGASLEIIEWRHSPGTAGESGRLADGRHYLFAERDGVVFLLRAPLPAERLAALAALVQPLP